MKITKEKVVHSHSPGVPSCFWVTMTTLHVLEITSLVYLAGNPLCQGQSGLQTNKANLSLKTMCHLFRNTPHHPPKQLQKKFSFQSVEKENSFWKHCKEHFIFIIWGWSRWRIWKLRPSHIVSQHLPIGELDEDHLKETVNNHWSSDESRTYIL